MTATVSIAIVTITDALAAHWLARNIENNRTIRPGKVDQYARDMAAGNWFFTGDPIKITEDDLLLDGQHRLLGRRKAGIDVDMAVAYNVDRAALPVIDTQTARTMADALKVSTNARHRPTVGAVLRRILMWDRGNRLGVGGRGINRYEKPTHLEMLARFNEEEELFNIAAYQADVVASASGLGVRSAAGTAFVLFYKIDSVSTRNFFDMLVSGADLPDFHPVLALRNRLIRGRDNPTEQIALYVRAWNAYRKDEPLERLVLADKLPLSNANYPTPI